MRNTLFALIVLLLLPAPSPAVSLSDVVLPETLMAGDQTLRLNGWGVRKKFFIKLYVGALYLPAPSDDASAILASDGPIAVRLHILSKLVSAKKMEKAIREGFDKSTGGQVGAIRSEVDRFVSFFHDNVAEDDIFDIVYSPDQGTRVILNGRELGVIDSRKQRFRRALFGIWLGPEPVQSDLREAMLGRNR